MNTLDSIVESLSILDGINWFANCGTEEELNNLSFSYEIIKDRSDAIEKIKNQHWFGFKVQAVGDLTLFLTLHHRYTYNIQWNEIIRQVTLLIDGSDILKKIRDCAEKNKIPDEVVDIIRFDLVRIVNEAYYIKKMPCPIFFEKLLQTYSCGHLPCGWRGREKKWPLGVLCIY